MGITALIIEAIRTIIVQGWWVFAHGGWIVLSMLVLYIMYLMYMVEIWGRFLGSQEPWILLQIKVEHDNLQSTLAVEQIFYQIHAMHTNFTWAEKYLEGKIQMWLSFEIVSIGGQIHYFVYFPHRYRNLIETSFYTRYPNAEITQVEDYMTPFKTYKEDADWDIWGTEFKYVADWAFPIKTYREFEHPTAEEKIIDPIAAQLEALGRIEPHELMGIQFVCRPVADPDWTPYVANKVKETRDRFAKESSGAVTVEEGMRTPILTEGQKRQLTAMEMKMSKPAYETKIRVLYIAPKKRFDGSKRAALIGGFRQLSGVVTNSLKPDVSTTWTNYAYKVFKDLEQPYVDYQIRKKKKKLLQGYAERSTWIGLNPMIMNVEEIATMYHFPLSTVTVPPVSGVDVKKGQPPANLPVL